MSDQTEHIELEIDEHTLLSYAMLAHAEDITLNQWFTNAVRSYLDGHQHKDDGDSKGNE